MQNRWQFAVNINNLFCGRINALIPRTRVKICGITRPEDGVEAARLVVDAIGLVFYEKSPRNVTLQQARLVCESLPAFVTVV